MPMFSSARTSSSNDEEVQRLKEVIIEQEALLARVVVQQEAVLAAQKRKAEVMGIDADEFEDDITEPEEVLSAGLAAHLEAAGASSLKSGVNQGVGGAVDRWRHGDQVIEAGDPVAVLGRRGDRRVDEADGQAVDSVDQAIDADGGDSLPDARITHDRCRADPDAVVVHGETGSGPSVGFVADDHGGQLVSVSVHGRSVARRSLVVRTSVLARVSRHGCPGHLR